MTSNFESNRSSQPFSHPFERELDSTQRSRFELLSAYLDGEVSLSERKQVQQWLDHDPETKKVYCRLLRLRSEVQAIEPPSTSEGFGDLPTQVFRKIRHRRIRQTVLWGGGAIAAIFVGAISSILLGGNPLMMQMATNAETELAAEPLMIAVNRPPVEIPKAAVAIPKDDFHSEEE